MTTAIQLLNYVQFLGKVGRSAVREYQYCGPERFPQRMKGQTVSLTPENALTIIQKSWNKGRIHVGTHIKKRLQERNVDMIDIQNVIRNGSINGQAEYCEGYKNWKYRVTGISDERGLDVIIALDFSEDISESPLAILVTVFDKNGGLDSR